MFRHGKHLQPGQKGHPMHPGAHPGGKKIEPEPGQIKAKTPAHQVEHGTPPKHVEHTHPGETQPHPETGVHAFHAHHTGGGAYRSHTHHDGGEVETREHPDHADMLASLHEAFPAQEEADEEHEGPSDGTEYAEELSSGIGGSQVA